MTKAPTQTPPKARRGRAKAAAERSANPAPEPKPPAGKVGELVTLLRRPEGATSAEMMAATGWQAHSVRGALSGAIKRKLGLTVISTKTETGRSYWIEAPRDAG